MIKQKNSILPGAAGKPILVDIFYAEEKPQPVVIYVHGFNGFKDWGNFDLIATQFAAAGFCFVKFNFSHGGTVPEAPEELTDLEAFGHNNYTKERFDLQQVITWISGAENAHARAIDASRLFLVGHSRGGGVALLKAGEENSITGVALWASVSEAKTPWGQWPAERLAQWQKTGVDFYTNSRTGQQMPLYYQLYEDYQHNQARLDILSAAARLAVPLLLCHGTQDAAVPLSSAYSLAKANGRAELFLVESDHVFGRKHPWPYAHLPQAMQAVVDKTISFFNATLL